jgi:CO/xanthine dehydrogenase FAD-binding subunit
MPPYFRPHSVSDALQALAGQPFVVVSGGTDFYPARVGRAISDPLLDISALEELRGIRELPDRFEIGALATWSDVLAADLPPAFAGLKLAAREVGGPQIQNVATLAGNLCNASPAADGVPPLLTLDAEVALTSVRGERVLPVEGFILGNRKTALAPDELLTAIRVPKGPPSARGGFAKLGARKYLVISIVMVAAVVEAERGRVSRARVAVGACAPVARRLPLLEAALAGRPLDGNLGAAAQAGHLAPLNPISDVRAGAAYRLDAALTLLRRLLSQLGAAA